MLLDIDDVMEDVTDTCGFVSDKPTIFVGAFQTTGYVQVLESAIILCDLDTQLQTRGMVPLIGAMTLLVIIALWLKFSDTSSVFLSSYITRYEPSCEKHYHPRSTQW